MVLRIMRLQQISKNNSDFGRVVETSVGNKITSLSQQETSKDLTDLQQTPQDLSIA